MATTTPNYGWTVPTSTDLVKDGATAIETLGDAIDASMNTALGTKKAGMVLLNTTSFSAVNAQSINSVFSATYRNYLILVEGIGSTTADNLNFRLRASGTDNTGATAYSSQSTNGNSTTISGVRENISSWVFGQIGSTNPNALRIEIYNPFVSGQTAAISHMQQAEDRTRNRTNSHSHNVTASYDGFTLFSLTGAATMTGSLSVYGYNI